MNNILSQTAVRSVLADISMPAAARYISAGAALLIGALLVFGAGFAGAEYLHNAAHDGRHAFAFPCH